MTRNKDKESKTEKAVRKALKREALKVKPKGTLRDIQEKIEKKGKGKGKDEDT